MDDQYAVKDLETKGLVRIAYPADLREAVEQTVVSWRSFCALPESERMKMPYNAGTGMGVGYELKKTQGANLDVKEDFNYALGRREWLADAARATGNEAITKFVSDVEQLVRVMKPFVVAIAASIEKEFALDGFARDIEDSQDVWFVRFLHYFGDRTEGEEIATAHADKDGFTPHLYESDPGLQYLDFKKQWQDMPVSARETAIISGMRLQYRSENRLKATYHRVIATRETARGGRFSAVCFVHPRRIPEYNKAKRGRLQEFQPGFNYEMPFEEFSKFFIS